MGYVGGVNEYWILFALVSFIGIFILLFILSLYIL